MKEGRKKEASKVKQITNQSNTAHPRQSLFQRKMSCLGWDSNPQHSNIDRALYQLYMYSIHVHVPMKEKEQGIANAYIQRRTKNDKKFMSSAAQRTHSGAVSITQTGAAGSEVVDPHHSPLFTRQELVRAARSGGHLEGEGGKGRERGVGRRG